MGRMMEEQKVENIYPSLFTGTKSVQQSKSDEGTYQKTTRYSLIWMFDLIGHGTLHRHHRKRYQQRRCN